MPRSAIRIAVVDDDASVRKALARLLTASSFDTKTYGSVREFMDVGTAKPPQCLVLDLHMPELSGLDLQHQLHPAVEVLDHGGAALDPIAAIDVGETFSLTNDGVVDVSADHAVNIMAARLV